MCYVLNFSTKKEIKSLKNQVYAYASKVVV